MRDWIDLVEGRRKPKPEPEDMFELLDKLPPAPKGLKYPRPEDLELINRVREGIRHWEGLGGQCHEVSEWIESRYGWRRESGTYLSSCGEPVCTDHFWNYLPDGSILDSTPDQHGEDEREIRIITPTDPEHKRYTCEWHEDWHPRHPDYDPSWDRERRDPANYSGKFDYDRENSLRRKRGGRYWYTDNKAAVAAYRKKERSYSAW